MEAELMLFGVLSLLLGHWTMWLARICIKSSAFSRRFYPCAKDSERTVNLDNTKVALASSYYLNNQSYQHHALRRHEYCPPVSPFASYESLEQLHRLLIVLAVIHVSYSFCTEFFADRCRLIVGELKVDDCRILFQFWCSYNTFPLYVIVTQMGSKFKKALVAENVRKSLHGWRERVKVKNKRDGAYGQLVTVPSVTSLDSLDVDEITEITIDPPMENPELPLEVGGDEIEIFEMAMQENPDETGDQHPQSEEDEIGIEVSSCSGNSSTSSSSGSHEEDNSILLPSPSIDPCSQTITHSI